MDAPIRRRPLADLAACMLLLATLCARAAPAGALFSSSTERSTAGWKGIPERLAAQLVARGDSDDRTQLEQAIREDGLPRNLRQFFRAHAVALATTASGAGRGRVLFVRPPTAPWHAPLYGAHVFRWWFVDGAGRVLADGASDEVAVLPASHAGLRDLVVSQCRGGACFDTTLRFDGTRYVDGACVTRAIDGGTVAAGCR